MDANTKKRYDKAGPQVVKALEKRHFEAYYVSTAAEAVERSGGADSPRSTRCPGRHRHGGLALGIKQRLAREGIALI